jgi:hypothetical protein
MRAVKLAGACLTTLALAGVFAGPTMAERTPEGPGQPLLSGDTHGEPVHGVLHCGTAGELVLGTTKSEGAGVIVVNKKGVHLAAPEGGTCESIYNVIFGG